MDGMNGQRITYEVGAAAISEYLDISATMRGGKDSRRNFESFCIEHGTAHRWSPLPRVYRHGIPKQCFRNAFVASVRHSGLIYCEGWALGVIPTHHAWCVDAAGKVYDFTWRGFTTEDTAYWGVQFAGPAFCDMICEGETYGVFYTTHGIRALKNGTLAKMVHNE